jgi:hypothetical protein
MRILMSRLGAATTLLALAACGGGTTPQPLSLSGTVSGLSASGLVLANGSSTVAVNPGATSFTFGSVLYQGMPYAITVQTQPSGETCSVANGTGTAGSANIANTVVTCASDAFPLGGAVSGLTTSGLVLANGSDTVAVAANTTTFGFPTDVAVGSSYAVTVKTQPTGEACSVTNGTATMPAKAVTTVAVTCTDQPFTLAGTISGLTTAGLVLANGTDTLNVDANATTFQMPSAVNFGSAYSLSVKTQPTGLTCSFSTGGNVGASSGTVPANDVTNIALVCSPQSYRLGGTVSGLTAGTVTLANGSATVNVTANGAFQMPTEVAYGSTYTVTVQTQPTGLTCSVGNATNTMPPSAVTNVTVTCAANTYTIGGSVTGLDTTGLVLQDNGTDDTSIVANATQFSLPALAYGSTYAVTILTQPSGQTCSVTDGTGGPINAIVTTVQVVCPQVVSFTTPGAVTWTVPAGVTSITLVVSGGGGGGSTGTGAGWGSTGGKGAVVTTTLSVSAGDVLLMNVGGGGAGAVSGIGNSGGGGGSSSVNAGTADQIIAGGGGGGGAVDVDYGGHWGGDGNGGEPTGVSLTYPGGSTCTAGGGSGGNGGPGYSGASTGGSGNGGAGGTSSSGASGGPGTGTGTGGTGATTCDGLSGGGGGGGFGGGAGGDGTGGAGGGSTGPTGSTYSLAGNAGSGSGENGANANNGGDGSIVITYTP